MLTAAYRSGLLRLKTRLLSVVLLVLCAGLARAQRPSEPLDYRKMHLARKFPIERTDRGSVPGYCVALSPDGHLMAVPREGDVQLFDPLAGTLVRTLATGCDAQALAFSDDGRYLAVLPMLMGQPTQIWDPRSGQLERSLPGLKGVFRSVTFIPGAGLLLAHGEGDQDPNSRKTVGDGLRFWDTHTWTLRSSKSMPAVAAAVTRDGSLLAVATVLEEYPPNELSCRVVLMDPKTEQVKKTLHVPWRNDERWMTGIGRMAFSPDGETLALSLDSAAVGDKKKSCDYVELWDVGLGKVKRRFVRDNPEFLPPVGAFCFSPDGKILAMASSSGEVDLCSLDTGEVKHSLHDLKRRPAALVFSKDGSLLAGIVGFSQPVAAVWRTEK